MPSNDDSLLSLTFNVLQRVDFIMWGVLIVVFSQIASFFVLALRYILIAVEYALNAYPEISTYAILLVAIYVAYKLFVRLVRLWINFVIGLIRITLFFLLVCLIAVIYVRGSKFFSQDLSLVGDYIRAAKSIDLTDYVDSVIRFVYSTANRGIWSILDVLSDFLFPTTLYGKGSIFEGSYKLDKNFASQGYEYIKNNKGKVTDFVNDNLGDVKFEVNNQKIDVKEALRNFLGNL